VIQSFRSKETARVFQEEGSRKLPSQIQELALEKLQMLHAAERLEDLAVFPGNRLEKLRGNREGQHSIRINNQWRICFVWRDRGAHEVEIVDYH
jgi:toxin HigB-1